LAPRRKELAERHLVWVADASLKGEHPAFVIALGKTKVLVASGTTVELDEVESDRRAPAIVVLQKGNARGLKSPYTAFFPCNVRWVRRTELRWDPSQGECPGSKFEKLSDAAHELMAREPRE